jgi:hypothetical protein
MTLSASRQVSPHSQASVCPVALAKPTNQTTVFEGEYIRIDIRYKLEIFSPSNLTSARAFELKSRHVELWLVLSQRLSRTYFLVSRMIIDSFDRPDLDSRALPTCFTMQTSIYQWTCTPGRWMLVRVLEQVCQLRVSTWPGSNHAPYHQALQLYMANLPLLPARKRSSCDW